MRKHSSLLLFLSTLWSAGSAVSEVTVTGRLTILGDTNSSGLDSLKPAKLDIGDEVTCDFQLDLNGGDKLRSVELVINATGLEFPAESPERFVEIKWTTATFTDSLLVGEQVTTLVDFEADNTQLIVQVSINGVLVRSISGFYKMVVSKKTARVGSGQSFLTVMPRLLSGEVMSAIFFYSTLMVTPLPLFDIKRADPYQLQMGEVATVEFKLDLPPGVLADSYAKVYLPYSEKNSEALMNVKKLKVKEVIGLSGEDGLMDIPFTTQSRTQSSEVDMATLSLPDVNTPSNATIVIHADSQLLDFNGFKDDSVLEICVGVKMNDDAIWMGRSHVTINNVNISSADLNPKLDITCSEFQRYVENKKVFYRIRLSITHNETSLASAYDVSAFVYYPSHVMTFEKSVKKVHDGIRPYSVTGEDGRMQFDLKRISFPISTKLMINLTLDTTNATYTEDRKLILLYDVVYRNWRRRKDLSTPTQHLELSVPNIQDDQTPPDSHKCPCPGDPTRTNCTCCRHGQCRCERRYGDKCVNCQRMWMCLNILPEFFKYSFLPEAHGDGFWACNNTVNPHDWRPFVPCIHTGDHFEELRPLPNTVATILGQDMKSGNLYGVNNNGLGYVYSKNDGHSWVSIPDRVYKRASSVENFRLATLV